MQTKGHNHKYLPIDACDEMPDCLQTLPLPRAHLKRAGAMLWKRARTSAIKCSHCRCQLYHQKWCV